MRIIYLVQMAGAQMRAPGEEAEVEQAEALRLIEAGYARPAREPAVEPEKTTARRSRRKGRR